MLLKGLTDLYYGLLTKDNLSEEYSMEIEKERFIKIITDVVSSNNNDREIEKIVLLIGNDF